jgi:Subtilase family
MILPGRFSLVPWLSTSEVRRRTRRMRLELEPLDERLLLSSSTIHAASDQPAVGYSEPSLSMSVPGGTDSLPQGTASPDGYTPSDILTAYGFNETTIAGTNGGLVTGAGQTIAIVDAYYDPNIESDLQQFDAAFGLPAPPSFTVTGESSTTLPPTTDTDPTGNGTWQGEQALDVEWAHVIAPAANIVLYEANSASPSDLFTAVQTAAASGASVVSMSWGNAENTNPSLGITASEEASYDPIFKQSGVTFVAATGDVGAPDFPALSPDVLAVGGTTLITSSSSSYLSETTWNDTVYSSGGGSSQFEAKPAFQDAVQSGAYRTVPDVSFNAGPSDYSGSVGNGYSVYDSFNPSDPSEPLADAWTDLQGTSAAAPQWAGIIALVDQQRGFAQLAPLTGYNQTLPMIYSLPSSDFHDITTGYNQNGTTATTGYDQVTGLGSPIANLVVSALSPSPTTTIQTFYAVGTGGQIGMLAVSTWDSTTGAWSTGFVALPGQTLASGTNFTVYTTSGRTDLYAVTENGYVQDIYWTASTGWIDAQINSTVQFKPGTPLSIFAPSGDVYLFGIGEDGYTQAIIYSATAGWVDTQINSTTPFAPGSSLTLYAPNGLVTLYGIAANGYLQAIIYSATAGWVDYQINSTVQFQPGTALSMIAPNGDVSLFGIADDGYAQAIVYSATAGWVDHQIDGTTPFHPGSPLTLA